MSNEITSASRKDQRAADVAERVGTESRMDGAEAAWRELSVEASNVIDVLRRHSASAWGHGCSVLARICPSCLVKVMEELDTPAVPSPPNGS